MISIDIRKSYSECGDGCCTDWDTEIIVKDKDNNVIIEENSDFVGVEEGFNLLKLLNVEIKVTEDVNQEHIYDIEKDIFYVEDLEEVYLDSAEIIKICNNREDLVELNYNNTVEEDMAYYMDNNDDFY